MNEFLSIDQYKCLVLIAKHIREMKIEYIEDSVTNIRIHIHHTNIFTPRESNPQPLVSQVGSLTTEHSSREIKLIFSEMKQLRYKKDFFRISCFT